MWLGILGLIAFCWIDSASAVERCDLELLALSQANLRAFLALPDHEPSEDDGSGGDRVYRRTPGRPARSRVAIIDQTIYRHYIGDTDQDPAEIRRQIIETRRLRAGKTPYVTGDLPWFRMTYPDVVGIFVTTPDWASEAVGVFKDLPYVDFRFPVGTALVELEPGILIVPGPRGTEIPIRPLLEH